MTISVFAINCKLWIFAHCSYPFDCWHFTLCSMSMSRSTVLGWYVPLILSQSDALVYLFQFFLIYIKFYLNIPLALIQEFHLLSLHRKLFAKFRKGFWNTFGTLSTIVLCLLNKFLPIISTINTLFFLIFTYNQRTSVSIIHIYSIRAESPSFNVPMERKPPSENESNSAASRVTFI